MSFLSPLTALFAALLAIPLLLLLYFLKLRRRYLRIASTLLWRQSYEDLEVNAPFQRLKWSALLLLQLLVLIALLLAMAQPIMRGDRGEAARLILLIDRSASMNAIDAGDGRSRLDAAKAAASETVERLARGAAAREVMVIAFGSAAHVVTTFQFDRSTLISAINAIEPTDEEANLAAALHLAAGFAGHSEEIGDQAAQIVLFSDGVIEQPEDPAGFRLRAGSFRFVRIGPGATQQTANGEQRGAANNIGIASFSARRDYDDPTRVLVFARFVNAGAQREDIVATLRAEGETLDVRRVAIPAAEENGPPGEATMTFVIELPDGGVLSLQHNHRDALASDDRAFLVMPPPTRPRVAIVHGELTEEIFLHQLVENFEPAALMAYSPEQFEQIDRRELDSGALYDLVIFDRVSGHRLPGVPSITFGGTPLGVGETATAAPGGKRFLSWDRQHPIMRQVSLDAIAYTNFGGYQLPHGATALAHGPEGPVIATMATRGARHVLVGFPLDLSRTNWPLHVSIAVFMQNVVEHLTLAGSGKVGLVHKPGVPVTVRARSDASAVSVTGPIEFTVETEPGGMRTLPALRRSGVYRVGGASPPNDWIAVSVLSDRESDIRPRSRLIVNAQPIVAGSAEEVVPRELWPWVLAAGLLLLVIEWLTYCRKAR